jgi:hypothetical protein
MQFMRDTTMQRWIGSDSTQSRESAWLMYQTISGFENALTAFINDIIKAETQA